MNEQTQEQLQEMIRVLKVRNHQLIHQYEKMRREKEFWKKTAQGGGHGSRINRTSGNAVGAG